MLLTALVRPPREFRLVGVFNGCLDIACLWCLVLGASLPAATLAEERFEAADPGTKPSVHAVIDEGCACGETGCDN